MRLARPPLHTEHGSPSDYYERSDLDGGYYLTLKGEAFMREKIREEQKLSSEARSRAITMWGAIIGAAGGVTAAVTGVIAVWEKLH